MKILVHFVKIPAGPLAIRDGGGTGPVVLFIHGNSLSSIIFRRQLTGSLSHHYRLLALDLPGHGDSPPAVDPEKTYTLAGYADAVRGVIVALDLHRPLVVGFSIGGNIVLEMLSQNASFAGAMIVGTAPVAPTPQSLAEAFLPHPDFGLVFQSDLSEQDVRAFARLCTPRSGEDDFAHLGNAIRRSDPRARKVFGESVATGNFADERAAVAVNPTPLAVAIGEADPLINPDYLRRIAYANLWRGGVVTIPGATHLPMEEAPEEFDRFIAAFTADAFART